MVINNTTDHLLVSGAYTYTDKVARCYCYIAAKSHAVERRTYTLHVC